MEITIPKTKTQEEFETKVKYLIQIFTELDELYHTIDEWEAFYALDKEPTDEDYE